MTTLKTVIPPPTAILAVQGRGFQGGLVMAANWYKWFDQFNSNINQLNAAVAAMGVWTAFTPVVTASAGTITTATGVGRYTTINKLVLLNAKLTVTTNGTGSVSIVFTLPVAAASHGVNYMGVGRETSVAGVGLVSLITAGASTGIVTNATGTYPAGDGYAMQISQAYEIA